MPALYLKLAGTVVVLLLLAGVAAGLYHKGYAAGKAEVRAADAKAVEVARLAVIAQQEQDNETAGVAIHGLQTELANVRTAVVPLAVPVRLCRGSAGSRSSGPAAEGAGSPEPRPPAPGSLQPVPDANPDLGPELQRFALACDTLSAEHRALLEWARGIAR